MRAPALLMVCATALAGCASIDAAAPEPVGHDVAEEVPHPGIAEGRPVVRIEQRGTFYLCPELAAGRTTPFIPDPCLVEGPEIGHTRIGGYSVLEPSVACANGRSATDAGTLGVGFVGEPLIDEGQSGADRGAVLDCLWGLDR